MKKALKYVGWTILIAAIAGLFWNGEMVLYGIGQGIGQAEILYGARPVEEVLADPEFPDSLKQRIDLVQEIRQFAIDSLGLNDSENYTTLYDQKGKPLLWVVSACPPFELEDYEWDYPLLGKLGYKGFFVKEKADAEAEELKALGLDTDVGTVSAWSTLGWFRDPILSEMLNRSEGMLARLIIHELTHATLYVPGDGDYNENLATFVGDNGAYKFLQYRYGKDSREYRDYEGRMNDIRLFSKHVLGGTAQLDRLYQQFDPVLSDDQKTAQKEALIHHILTSADTLPFYDNRRYQSITSGKETRNNTFFMTYKMYRAEQNDFQLEFQNQFNSDFRAYLSYLKEKYPSV